MFNRPYFLLVCLIVFLAACSQTPTADYIYYDTKIWTGDPANPEATSLAIKDSLILYVGNDYAPYSGNHTILVDLEGKLMVPGFIDNHVHFLDGGYFLANINLREARSTESFISTLRHFADSSGGNQWITGGYWDHEAWGGQLPLSSWIDSVSGAHPVFVSRYDGHMGLANSIALKMAGINRLTPNPPGGGNCERSKNRGTNGNTP
jgi:predicted amidohydrolase YtcJ